MQVASQFWIILSFVADSIAVAAQGLIADRMGSASIPAARDVASRVRALALKTPKSVNEVLLRIQNMPLPACSPCVLIPNFPYKV